jgi:hypothetical protein
MALLNAEIGRGGSHTGLPEQLANDLDVMGVLIDQGSLGPPQGVGAELPRIESGRRRLAFDQAAVLGSTQRLGRVFPHAGEEILPGQFARDGNPLREDLAAIGEEGHNGPLTRFLLTDSELLNHRAGMVGDIFHFQGKQIGTTQHGVNPHGEGGQVSEVACVRENLFDGLDVTGTERGFLTYRFPFVPG